MYYVKGFFLINQDTRMLRRGVSRTPHPPPVNQLILPHAQREIIRRQVDLESKRYLRAAKTAVDSALGYTQATGPRIYEAAEVGKASEDAATLKEEKSGEV